MAVITEQELFVILRDCVECHKCDVELHCNLISPIKGRQSFLLANCKKPTEKYDFIIEIEIQCGKKGPRHMCVFTILRATKSSHNAIWAKKKENKRGNDNDWIRYKKISDAGLKRMWVMVFIVRELNLYAHRIEKSDVSVNNEK